MDPFTQAYVECALWSSSDESDESGGLPMDINYSDDDIAPETLAIMEADCVKFQADNAHDLEGENLPRAGHDFWLTRNGHGAGFWDGDYEESKGKRLTKASKAYGEFNLYIGDDSKVYGN